MNLLQRKIEMNRRSQSASEDPRLAGAALAAVKDALPGWIGEEGWAITRSGSQWVKSAALGPQTAPENLHLYREGAAILMVGVSAQAALRASAFALGCDPDGAGRKAGAFERHHGKALCESIWQGLTGLTSDYNMGNWAFLETASPVPFANGPEQLLKLSVTLTREETSGEYNLVLFAQDIPLREIALVSDDEDDADADELDGAAPRLAAVSEDEDDIFTADIEDLKERLGPCRLAIHVVGEQIELSVADCTRLEIGQMLRLPRLRFDDVSVRLVSGGRQRDLARGTLGMDSGRKAVKLHAAPDADFFADAADFIDEADVPARR